MHGKLKFYQLIIALLFVPLLPLLAETFIYSGFFKNFFNADISYIIYIGILAGTYYLFFNKDKHEPLIDLLINLLILLLFVTTVAVFILGYLEEVNFPNYVFSVFHVHYHNIPALVSYVFYLLFLLLIKNETKTLLIEKKLSLKLTSAVFFLLSVYLVNNSNQTLSLIERKVITILVKPNITYNEKMSKEWGFFYNYMLFVRENTPSDAIVHLPPKLDPWQLTGNIGLVRYFLYPRQLVNTSDPFSLSNKKFDYLLISKGFFTQAGESGHGWPKIPIEADKIWYIDENTKEVEEFNGQFIPHTSKDWGLIKLVNN
jgi:hypothetical protein